MKTRAHDEPSEKVSSFGPTLKFMRLLWAVDHELQSASKRMKKTLGVTGPQRLVLRVLGRSPGSTPGHVARTLLIDPSTLTGVLKRLEDKNLIQRKMDPEDGRRAFLFLTTKGRTIDSRTSGTVESAVRKALSGSDPAELEAARNILVRIDEELRRNV